MFRHLRIAFVVAIVTSTTVTLIAPAQSYAGFMGNLITIEAVNTDVC